MALFPEMWSDGYYLPEEEDKVQKLAIAKDSSFVNAFRDLANELEMAIGITFLESNDPKPLNSVVFFDRTGKEILHYSKVHTCAFSDEAVLSEGEDFHTADLDFGRGTVKFGSMICFDREFPESARILMLKGAELILAPNACPMEINRLAALRTRAYENMLAVATCNYPKDSLTVMAVQRFSMVWHGFVKWKEQETCACLKHRKNPEFMLQLSISTSSELTGAATSWATNTDIPKSTESCQTPK